MEGAAGMLPAHGGFVVWSCAALLVAPNAEWGIEIVVLWRVLGY